MKICCACKKEKEMKYFYVNSRMRDGHFARCKTCFNQKKLCNRGRKNGEDVVERRCIKKYKNSFLGLRLLNTSKQDYIETYKFLQRLGYNLSESIHEQFCEKHSLNSTEPQQFKNHFSTKDCGLA
jgi:hypothetical protein